MFNEPMNAFLIKNSDMTAFVFDVLPSRPWMS